MRGDEVNAGRRQPPAFAEQTMAAGEATGEIADAALGAAPEIAQRVAILAVPLAPARWEVADLIAVFTHVPRLGDELGLRDDRVLPQDIEEGGARVEAAQLAAQRRRQIEAEAIHVHLLNPIAQAVADELQHVRLDDVEGVAGAGEVVIVARLIEDEAIIAGVVEALERKERAEVVALAGVVVNHVEDDLETGAMQRLHHLFELGHLLPAHPAAGVAGLGREEAEGLIAPVIGQPALDEMAVEDELMHRQQLNRCHTQRVEIVEHRRARQPEVRSAQRGRHLWMARRESFHVRFVDDALRERGARRAVCLPIEGRVNDDTLG